MKKILILMSLITVLTMSFIPVYALDLTSNYAYLVDTENDLVYLDVRSNEKIYPASMTKIVTLMCALEKIDDISKEVIITYEDLEGLYEANASVCGLSVNEKVTVEDLLYGVLLPSGADACNALARITYGSLDQLVQAMNEKVKELNLKDTHFVNVTGLHEDEHYTTCHDMARLLEEALKNDVFKKVFEAREYTSSSSKHTWYSSLKRGGITLNRDTSCIDGGKSGFTYEANLTYASSMTIDNHEMICVVADAHYTKASSNVADTLNIYHDINDHYSNLNVFKSNDLLKTIKIQKTKHNNYEYCIDKDIDLLMKNGISKADLQIDIDMNDEYEAPLEKGTKLGTLTIKHDDKILYQDDLLLNETIEPDMIGLLFYYGPYIISAFVICVGLAVIYKKYKH